MSLARRKIRINTTEARHIENSLSEFDVKKGSAGDTLYTAAEQRYSSEPIMEGLSGFTG